MLPCIGMGSTESGGGVCPQGDRHRVGSAQVGADWYVVQEMVLAVHLRFRLQRRVLVALGTQPGGLDMQPSPYIHTAQKGCMSGNQGAR